MKDYRLTTFLTVCDTMNYRLTAEKLHITQPAVTQHIHALEQYYECKLFIYDGRRLTKTDSAKTLEQYARSLEYQESKLMEALHPAPSVHLNIGATKSIGEFVISKHIASFLSNQSNNVSVSVDNTRKILHLLDTGKLDFAIIEGNFDRSSYGSFLYQHEPFVGICSPSHPFAGKNIDLDQLWKENLLVREEGSGTRYVLELIMAETSHTLNDFNRTTTVNSFGLLCELIALNAGISFAYKAVAENYRNLKTFHVDGLSTSREFNYVYLNNTIGEALAHTFDTYRSN